MSYYTCQGHLEELFADIERPYAFDCATPEAYTEWSAGLRARLSCLLGMDNMRATAPAPRLLEEVQCQGYVRRKLVIQTEPGVAMPFYMLIPDAAMGGEKRSAVIACHGHSSNGKVAVAGVRDGGAVDRAIEHYNYNYGEVLAQKGYVVFAPDARGFGERREAGLQSDSDSDKMSSSCGYLNKLAISLNQSLLGMWVWDLMRLADFALACPEVDGRIGCVGLSGGGMQSLWLGALDTRMACCVVSGYFYGYLEALLINDNCDCNYVPGLWTVADIGDIGALIAPRPLLIETGDKDSLNGRSGLANVTTQVATVRRAMELLGRPENLYHDIFDGEHRWNGECAYGWMLKYMPPSLEEKV